VQRRSILKGLLSGAAMATGAIKPGLADAGVFRHGVASGDPTSNSIILWTRLSVEPAERSLPVSWQIASGRDMRQKIASGHTSADASGDFTVKVDAGNLPAGRTLFYRFSASGEKSMIGRTKTLPDGTVSSLSFAVVSCANYPAGFFHVYREIANRDDLDAVLHLGDYIYEYGMGEYATDRAQQLDRIPEPLHETLTLADYRLRHAQYKRDPDSQAMLASLPLIAVWDDHEIANDAWRGGAENHRGDEGDWAARRNAAIQAYFEWMPIRGSAAGGATRIYRDFRWGDLASLIMLDTRLIGRDPQPYIGENVNEETILAALQDPERRLLGRAQEEWLRQSLRASTDTTWQIIGQQVMVTELKTADLEPLVDIDKPSTLPRERLLDIVRQSKQSSPYLFDTWDGYPLARDGFLADLEQLAANPVVLSGDLHTSLAANICRAGIGTPVTVEYMASSVTSPGFSEYLPDKYPNAVRDGTLEINPALQYLETTARGWLCLRLTPERCTGEWHLINGIFERNYRSWRDKTLTVHAGEISKGLR